MTRYAQTNLELYAELLESRWPESEIGQVRQAYGLAMRLFAGRFRASGKPYLAHSVGTASILVRLKVRCAAVAAGLVHAAYTRGEFGDGRRGISDRKRRVVREAVGAEIEELVAGYTALVWNANTIPDIHARVDTLSAAEREVLLMRLANELEDHWDLGILYMGGAERHRAFIRSSLHRSADMAQKLGMPQLAAELESAFSRALTAELPEVLRRRENYGFTVAPLSHRPRLRVTLRRFVRKPERILPKWVREFFKPHNGRRYEQLGRDPGR